MTEEQYQSALWRTFDLADELMGGVTHGRLWPDVLDGSPMALDNIETESHQLAHVIQTLIYSAIEPLHATAGPVRKAGLLHNATPFTLPDSGRVGGHGLRDARAHRAEAAAQEPPGYVRHDNFDYEQVSTLVAERTKKPVNGDDFAKRRAWAVRVKEKHHITGLPNKLQYERMIVEVDKAIALHDRRENDKHVETHWKTASGFIHGRQWATLNVLVREEVMPLGTATAAVKLSSTYSRVL